MMGIRLQSMMAILPIFMAVGIISAYLRYTSELEELAWGLRSEAEGYAISIESALHGEPLKRIIAHDEAGTAAIFAKIDRVIQGNRVRRVAIFSPDRAEILFHRETESAAKQKLVLEADAIRSLADVSVWVTNIERGPDDSAFLHAYIPLTDDAGQLLGALVVETDAAEYVRYADGSFRQLVEEGGGVLLLGFICALVIAQVLRRRIHELNNLAVEIGSGSLPEYNQTGAIRELRDLKDSLQTMSSIMTDILSRAKRGLLEKEQFRSEKDLSDAYREECFEDDCVEIDGTQLVSCRGPERADGDFAETCAFEDKVCIVFGRVAGKGLSEQIRESSAAGVLSAELVRRKGAERAWETMHKSFRLESWSCVSYSRNATFVEVWQAATDGSKLNYQMHPIGRGHMLFHSRLGQPNERVRKYVEVFGGVPPYELKAELASLVKGDEHGTLVIVGEA